MTPKSDSPMPAGFFTSCKVRVVPAVTPCVRTLKPYAGTFSETSSPENQLHWILENCKVVRSANGLPNIVEAMKIASSKHDLLWSVLHDSRFHTRILLNSLQQSLGARRCSFPNLGPGPCRHPGRGHHRTFRIPWDALSRHRNI